VSVIFFLLEIPLLSLIDEPDIGDVRGVGQNKQNCDHILSCISHYGHLNGICVLLKPNIEGLAVGFRLCFKEILTHLHINDKYNLLFIFTNGRSTLYRPSTAPPVLRTLLNELNKTWNVVVPFNKDNTFMFDNETFRFSLWTTKILRIVYLMFNSIDSQLQKAQYSQNFFSFIAFYRAHFADHFDNKLVKFNQ
jgi:hypothetical protein